ncbi:MAG: M61 family metallopeptidase [Gemmatimonadales bacterium]|nr:M61 family metallopeptidase [Gemmatimonadales bacterium]
MRAVAILWFAFGIGELSAQASPPVTYEISFPNAAHHEAEIVATFSGLPAGSVELWMSRSSPGRYAVHEFAKNVYNLRAEDSRGRPLQAAAANPHSWRVTGHDGTVRVRYTLFGDLTDGTYAQIDRTHAHLNVPATFLWAKGQDHRPRRVTFTALPAGWRVATQLAPTKDPVTFTAPNFQLFMDSPIEVGPVDIRAWPVKNGARTDTIRLAIHHTGTAAEVDQYVELIKRVVAEQAGVFGELPKFDWGTYTFLADYLPWASGDGMEHRNSTVVSDADPLAGAGMMANLRTVAHEFFHAWNVERIRPKTLEPFDFTEANMSGELWLAEGFTNYYGPLSLRRAEITDDATFARSIGGAVNSVVNGPGRHFFSAVEMSRQAPFVDAARPVDPHNRANTFISYYTWGQVIATGLDLTLRTKYSNVTLDDFMRAMWAKHGRTEKPYTLDDVRLTLGEVTRDQAFADDFFRRYIAGREVVDFPSLFAAMGFLFRPTRSDQAWLGDATLQSAAGGASVTNGALVGQPLYLAGVERGDLITALDGRPVASGAEIDSIVSRHKPGDSLPITFVSRGGANVTATLVLKANPRFDLVPAETAGQTVSEAAMAARRRWLASRAGAEGAPR